MWVELVELCREEGLKASPRSCYRRRNVQQDLVPQAQERGKGRLVSRSPLLLPGLESRSGVPRHSWKLVRILRNIYK